MKGILPAFLFGALAALTLFGVLSTIEPDLSPNIDRWRIEWEKAGLDVQFRAGAAGDEGGLLLRRLRGLFEKPEYEGTKVRRYDVNLIRTEVIRLPHEGLLDELPEGRHPKFKLGNDPRRVHACRSGRYVVLVSLGVRVAFQWLPSNKDTIEKIFDVFETTAEQLRR